MNITLKFPSIAIIIICNYGFTSICTCFIQYSSSLLLSKLIRAETKALLFTSISYLEPSTYLPQSRHLINMCGTNYGKVKGSGNSIHPYSYIFSTTTRI